MSLTGWIVLGILTFVGSWMIPAQERWWRRALMFVPPTLLLLSMGVLETAIL